MELIAVCENHVGATMHPQCFGEDLIDALRIECERDAGISELIKRWRSFGLNGNVDHLLAAAILDLVDYVYYTAKALNLYRNGFLFTDFTTWVDGNLLLTVNFLPVNYTAPILEIDYGYELSNRFQRYHTHYIPEEPEHEWAGSRRDWLSSKPIHWSIAA